MKKSYHILILFCFVLFGFGVSAQEGLHIQIEKDYSNTGKLKAYFQASNFDDIYALQFSIAYPGQDLVLDSITSSSIEGVNTASYVNDPSSGRIKFLWFDGNATGVSIADGSNMIVCHFSVVNDGTHNIYASDCPLDIEVVQNINSIIPLIGDVIYECGGISGYATMDLTQNCLEQNGNGLANWTVLFYGEQVHSTKTYANGFYRANIPAGGYDVVLVPPNDLWTPCTPVSDVITVAGETTQLNLTAVPDELCYDTYVEITTPFLRRCFQSSYYVAYGNAGTIPAEEAAIEVQLDEGLTFISADVPPSSMVDNILQWNLGTLEPGDADNIRILVEVGCDSVLLGETHCTTAKITPDTLCAGTDWSMANVETNATCLGDSVALRLTNTGPAQMTTPMDVYVIEDDVIVFLSTFQLDPGAVFEKKYPANGSTWRIQAGQELNHPQSSKVYAAIEGCDLDGDGNYSTGFMTQFVTDPQDNSTSQSCAQNIGSFDPNDKLTAFRGSGDQHYIEPDKTMDYTIRFQNTGTDTAFNVRVIDTLSSHLNVARLNMISSSHPYEIEIRDGNILDIYFNDILLVDSFTNEPLSNGFFRYQIEQSDDIPLGSVIENTAAIYFDFNEPVITNTVWHTVDINFLDMSTGTKNPPTKATLKPFPNPAKELVTIPTPDEYRSTEVDVQLLNIEGKLIYQSTEIGENIHISTEGYQAGIYFVKMTMKDGHSFTGKISIIK